MFALKSWRLEEVVKTLLSVFVLGYVIVFFSTLFKGGCKSDRPQEEIAKDRYWKVCRIYYVWLFDRYYRFDSSFLRQQLIEKNLEIQHLESEKSILVKKLAAEDVIKRKQMELHSSPTVRPGVIILGLQCRQDPKIVKFI